MQEPWTRRRWALLFLAFSIAWLVTHWVALSHAWWFADDFVRITGMYEWWQRGLLNGRPGESLWFLTFKLDPMPQGVVGNITLRLFQSAVHVVNSVLIARLLCRIVSFRVAVLAAAFFLLWCFNSEAALWRSGAPYVLAANLSLWAALIVELRAANLGRGVLAAALCIAAVLTNQMGAMAGLTCWALLFGARLLQGLPWSGAKRVIPLLAGYLIGGVASIAITRMHFHERAAFATDLNAKLAFWVRLQELFWFFPDHYPLALQILSGLFLVAAVICLVRSARRKYVLPLFLVIGSVLPFAPNLLVAECSPTWRAMYLAPLLLVLLLSSANSPPLSRIYDGALFAIVTAVVLLNAGIGFSNSMTYLEAFRFDVALARELDAKARQVGASGVVLLTNEDAGRIDHWNPAGVRYQHQMSHLSAFLISWATPIWFESYSSLPVRHDDKTVAIARDWCRAQPHDRAYIISDRLPETDVVVFCQR